jgi:Skp family chaperone for outer membrane proteins
MPTPKSAILTAAVSLTLGLAPLAHAQAPAAAGAPNAAQAPAGGAAPTAGAATPMRIGAVDIEKIFDGYEKTRFLKKQLETEMVARNAELTKLRSGLTALGQELQGLDPNGNDFRTKEAEATKLNAELTASMQQAKADFSRKQAEALATIYKDVQSMSDLVMQHYGFQMVVKVSNTPPSASDPNSVMEAMANSILCHSPSIDITNVVLTNLNAQYKKQGGTVVPPDAKTDAAATPTSATAPASATATPAAAPAPRTATAPAARTPR